ncbi:hypothetical protein ACKWTF_014255 [Chironomus riparius]
MCKQKRNPFSICFTIFFFLQQQQQQQKCQETIKKKFSCCCCRLSRASLSTTKTKKSKRERDEIVYVYKSPGACGSSLVVDKHVCEGDSNNKKRPKRDGKFWSEKNKFKLKIITN